MAKQTKAELLEKVSKARRKKLEEELTEVVNLMAPHLKALVPIEASFNDIRERYGRLKVEDGVVGKLLEAIFEELHPELFKEWMKTESPVLNPE